MNHVLIVDDETEIRNTGEGLQFQTEKFLADNGDKLPADKKTELEAALETLKSALNGADFDAIKSAQENLSRVSQEAGGAMYDAASAAGAAGGAGAAGEPGAPVDDETVVDAEVVDEGPADGPINFDKS